MDGPAGERCDSRRGEQENEEPAELGPDGRAAEQQDREDGALERHEVVRQSDVGLGQDTFDATQGDIPLIEIVGALKPVGPGTCDGFASLIALYDSVGNVLAMGDAECATATEARIFNSTLLTTGTYTVVVSGYPHWAEQDFVAQNMEFATRPHNLFIRVSDLHYFISIIYKLCSM